MLVRLWSNGNAHSLLVGMQNGASTLENGLAVSHKTKHTLTIWPSNHAPWYLPKGAENLCPHKTLHTNVYSSFIHNCENLEATKVSFSRWTDKLLYIHTTEYFSAIKRNELSSHEKNLKCTLLSERSQSEKATYGMIPIILHFGKDKTMETEKRTMVARA